MEIALRFHIACHSDVSWDKFFISLRGTLNNLINVSTGKTLNEIIYSIKLNNGTDITNIAAKGQIDMIDNRNRNRQKAIDAVAFAAAEIKIRYNKKHKPLVMEPGDQAFVKLHYGYKLSGLKNSKLFDQRTESFPVLRQWGNLAYELDLPKIWKVHSIFSVAMLEPALKGQDPYRRPWEEGQEPISDENDPTIKDNHEIEKLIDRQKVRPRGRNSKQKSFVIQYLVKWKNWGPAHNAWYNIKDLGKAKELMDDYDSKFGLMSMKEF